MQQAFSFRLERVSRRNSRTLLIGTLLVMILSFGTFSAAPAAHAASPSVAKRCAVVLAPLQPGEHTSRVLSSQCVQGNQSLATSLTNTLLITVFVGANFSGNSIQFLGGTGPCDLSGYRIDQMPSGFNNGISSYLVFHNCIHVRSFDGPDETGASFLTTGNVSDLSLNSTGFNNRINSMHLFS
ncbi:MAG TPA: hypothetical protein VFB60_12745 [Ktedonobacteraceae bacterium]|nr:hypothetical protein [Ktedonobacteraceae bacterium]